MIFHELTSDCITFVQQAAIVPEYLHLAGLDAEARRRRGEAARAAFRERFAPRRIFERAGVYARLDALLLAAASPRSEGGTRLRGG